MDGTVGLKVVPGSDKALESGAARAMICPLGPINSCCPPKGLEKIKSGRENKSKFGKFSADRN